MGQEILEKNKIQKKVRIISSAYLENTLPSLNKKAYTLFLSWNILPVILSAGAGIFSTNRKSKIS